MRTGLLTALLATVMACLAPSALAAGGNYVFQGGTTNEQQQVRNALNASTFNWSLVPGQVTIVIAPTPVSESSPGTIYLDSGLLDSAGTFSWGVVQNEYAQQVQFLLLPAADQTAFTTALGASAWCYENPSAQQLSQQGCERFASTLAWSYWTSPENSVQPRTVGAVASGMAPAAFRALLTSALGEQTQDQPIPVVSSTKTTSTKATIRIATTQKGVKKL